MHLSSVDFPDPFAPTTAVTPLLNATVTFVRAMVRPS
ncbi:hypothetical protein FHR89_001209 [Cellulomonas uda]|nr:hypothetical protein [Cellulomonas uda]